MGLQQEFHHPHEYQQEQQLLHRDLNQEKAHLMEDMEIPRDVSTMSEEELMFYYFRMHDIDQSGKLDGCELVKSLIHWTGEGHGNGENGVKIFSDDELAIQ